MPLKISSNQFAPKSTIYVQNSRECKTNAIIIFYTNEKAHRVSFQEIQTAHLLHQFQTWHSREMQL
jgi:hypothetical protein